MKRILIVIALQFVAFTASSEELSIKFEADRDNWFFSSAPNVTADFDIWAISSGYSYPVRDKVRLFVGTEIKSSSQNEAASHGLLSGIEYNFSDVLSFSSGLQTDRFEDETINSFGMSSHLQVTENLDIRAGFDVELNQPTPATPIYQLGLGIRF